MPLIEFEFEIAIEFSSRDSSSYKCTLNTSTISCSKF